MPTMFDQQMTMSDEVEAPIDDLEATDDEVDEGLGDAAKTPGCTITLSPS